MDTPPKGKLISLSLDRSVWEQVFTVAPLVVIGTKEEDGFDLAPKHMAMPLGDGPYFGFVCTPKHGTYRNIKRFKEFTVSFPKPEQVVATSLSASPRNKQVSKSEGIIKVIPKIMATAMDLPMLGGAYFYLECKLLKIIDGFDDQSIIAGKIVAAHADEDYLRLSENDERDQLKQFPLLSYIAEGRFASIRETLEFPFPKDFKK